jgi:4-hydroxybenzoate polyprenyltransferase
MPNILTSYLSILRPLNLLIVCITQILLTKFFIKDLINHGVLSWSQIFLLSFITCIIGGSGYVVNDIYDIKIDTINRPDKVLLGKTISPTQAWIYYVALLTLGFVLSVLLAIQTSNLHLIPIYPFAVVLLFLYAKYFKIKGYIGNIIVALMTSFVGIILIVAERNVLFENSNILSLKLVLFFCVFAFFINLIREIIKDIEDMDGDRVQGSNSLPLSEGISRTKIIINVNLFALIIFLLMFLYDLPHKNTYNVISTSFIILLLCVFFFKLNDAMSKSDYKNLSKFLKLIMLSGLIYLILISKNLH